jgi:Ca2+-binding EF-hand superfamily protein
MMRVLPIMTALDADGNGEISDAEINGSVAALKKLDKNKDNKLTAEELRPNFGGNRGGRGGSGIPDRSPASVTQPLKPLPPVAKQIEGVSSREILKLFGAHGRHGGTERELANYRRVFGFTDADRDGRHSKKEYIENGAYLTPQSRQGIFHASDSNNDGFVSEAEYVENRLITDEAKLIFGGMDANGNNRLTAKELLASGKLKDQKLANGVFKALDTNEDGELIIPEYLRVWGRWARH